MDPGTEPQREKLRGKNRRASSRYFESSQSTVQMNGQAQNRGFPNQIPNSHFPAMLNVGVKTNFDSLMCVIRAHKVFKLPRFGTEVRDQPKYDSCTKYDITDGQEDELWILEAKRLLAVVQNPSEDMHFDGAGILGLTTREGYDNLSALSDQILCNHSICLHDNYLLTLEHWPDFFHIISYRSSKRVLTGRFGQQDDFDGHAHRRTQQPPKRLVKQNTEAYYALVDYVTAVIAKLAVECVISEFWQNHCLSILAKWATKLKVLVRDPVKYAARSLETASDLFLKEQAISLGHGLSIAEIDDYEEYDQQQGSSQKPTAKMQMRPMMNRKKQLEEVFAPEEDQAIAQYSLEMDIFHLFLAAIFQEVLGGLKASSISGFSTQAFEISSLVYGTGFSGTPILLSQDRHGEITATSDTISVQNGYAAFKMTLAIAKATKERSATVHRPPSFQRLDAQTTLWLELNTGGELEYTQPIQVAVSTIDDSVSLMVPLIAATPPVLTTVSQMFDLAALWCPVNDPQERFPPVQFTGLLSMRTDAYDNESVVFHADDEVRPLSRSLMVHQRLLSTDDSLSSTTTRWRGKSAQDRQQEIGKTLAEFQELEARIEKEWTIDENTITVRCPKYVGVVMSLAGVLVIGGLVEGLTVHNHLTGVDPFNITTYCWVLAGFLVVIAQSIRVENWPWRDFLRGRVVCRSVREICEVEKVNQQHVLLYLLHNESRLIIATRGPYNFPFNHASMTDGFSIDVKPELRTLLLSGIIAVKVATSDGPALVCLDARKKMVSRLASIEHHHNDRDRILLACTDLPRKGEPSSSNRGGDLDIDLERTAMRWYRVIGLYNLSKCKFK